MSDQPVAILCTYEYKMSCDIRNFSCNSKQNKKRCCLSKFKPKKRLIFKRFPTRGSQIEVQGGRSLQITFVGKVKSKEYIIKFRSCCGNSFYRAGNMVKVKSKTVPVKGRGGP
jgi:hypothetical protein